MRCENENLTWNVNNSRRVLGCRQKHAAVSLRQHGFLVHIVFTRSALAKHFAMTSAMLRMRCARTSRWEAGDWSEPSTESTSPTTSSIRTTCWELELKPRYAREGWKAEFTWVTGYMPTWFTRPQTITRIGPTSYLTINPVVRCVPPVSLSSKCPG